MIDLSIYKQKIVPFSVKGVEDIKYYNIKPLKGRFMNVEADIPIFSEFIKKPYHFTGMIDSKASSWTECIMLNNDDYLKALDSYGNFLYSICILHSETFFEYFVPSLKYSNTDEYDNYHDRWEYLTDIKKYFDDSKTKETFIDFCTEGPRKSTMDKIIIKDTFGHWMIDRKVLWYLSLEDLKGTIDDFKYFIQGERI